MKQKLTASVIGCGMGGRLSMTALAASDRFELVAATDLAPAARTKAEADYPGLRTFADQRAMFAACPTDVVCVSTWAPSHQAVTLEALQLPGLRGILVEKPLGDTAAAGRAILEAVRSRGLPMAVPHGLLVAAHGAEILRLVKAGRIGALKLVEIENCGWDIINAGIHWLNFFVALTGGEPVAQVLAACDCTTRTYRDGMQVETVAVTHALTASGVRVVMNTGDEVTMSCEGKKTLFRLVGTLGMIEFWGWESAYRIWDRECPEGRLVQVAPFAKSKHQIHLERLADEVERGAPCYDVAESSLTALELCEAAYLSHRHACAVTFPLQTFRPPARVEWSPGLPYAGQGGGRDGRQFG